MLLLGSASCSRGEGEGTTAYDHGEYAYCFVAGTRIATPTGAKRIETVRVGDRVWSFDVDAGRLALGAVSAIMERRAPHVLSVEAGDHHLAGVTPTHPFYDPVAGAWVQAGKLRVGSPLLVWDERGEPSIERVTRLRGQPVADTVVYELEVDGLHAYFAEGVLVHNKQPERNDWDGDDFYVRADGTREGDEDCDDADASVHPYAAEQCDGVDQNCDGVADEGCTTNALPAAALDHARFRETGGWWLAEPFSVDLGANGGALFVAAVDLAGEPRTISLIEPLMLPYDAPPPPWQTLPEDARAPAVVLLAQHHHPERASEEREEHHLVIVALTPGEPPTAQVVLSLPAQRLVDGRRVDVRELGLMPGAGDRLDLELVDHGDRREGTPSTTRRFTFEDGTYAEEPPPP